MFSYANGVFWRDRTRILKTSSDWGKSSEYAIQKPKAAGLFRESCNVFSNAKSSMEQIACSFLKKNMYSTPTYISMLVHI